MKVVGFAGLFRQRQDHAGRAADPRTAAARPAGVGGQARPPPLRHRPPGKDTFRHREAGAFEVVAHRTGAWP
jgi:molybdopterin-guanine dinucleotide biosynthesis protein